MLNCNQKFSILQTLDNYKQLDFFWFSQFYVDILIRNMKK